MHTILSGWNFARWLRLAAGLIIGILSIRMQDELGGFIAALFCSRLLRILAVAV